MKYLFILLYLSIPLLHFADIYIDFESMSYELIERESTSNGLSNINIIAHHPYQKNLSCVTLSTVLTNFHRVALEKLSHSLIQNNNRLYFIVNPFMMDNNSLFNCSIGNNQFIPNFQNTKEVRHFINRLLLISQNKLFNLVIDLSIINKKQRAKIESLILKELPSTIFINGSIRTVSTNYYIQLKKDFQSGLTNIKQLETQQHKTSINKITDFQLSGNITPILFWMLSQKKNIYLDYRLLQHRYILKLVQVLELENKPFRIHLLEKDFIFLYSSQYLLSLNLKNSFGYKTINNNIIPKNALFKNLYGSSPLTTDQQSLSFIIWPYSVLIWEYQQ